MATHYHHHHPRTTPHWATAGLTRARRLEGKLARHWAFTAYALLTLATAGYIVVQLAPLA